MALKKRIETNYVFIAEYWRITNLVVSKLDWKVSFDISLYKDQESRLNNNTFILSRGYSFILDKYIKENGIIFEDPVAISYKLLKEEVKFFNDAEDC